MLERSCHFYNKVEIKKNQPCVREQSILDIEDLVTIGKKHSFCPYFMSKELKQQADIIFMPYNYILDHRARKSLGIELSNNIIILDEAHNIEKICEDSASIEIKTTDITLCIEEVTDIMKVLVDDNSGMDEDVPRDFSAEELCILKEMLLKFEKAVDEVEMKQSGELTTFEGRYIFELLSKCDVRLQLNVVFIICIHTNVFLQINDNTAPMVVTLIETIIGFITTRKQSGPFQRKGNGLQLFGDLLRIVFISSKPDFKDKLNKCYKVRYLVQFFK